jgi:hypothetical protein
MTDVKRTGTILTTAVITAAGLGFVPSANADEQYKADRAYCMSGSAAEDRDLCLKEAAAAQAQRQRESSPPQKVHRKKEASKKDAAEPVKKNASTS